MNYDFQRYQAKIEAGTKKANLNDLREEIALTRIMIESLVNRTENETEFIALIPSLNPLIGTLDRLTTNNAKLEAFFGQFMTPEQVDIMVSNILDIIVDEVSSHVEDSGELLGRLADRIGEATTLLEVPVNNAQPLLTG